MILPILVLPLVLTLRSAAPDLLSPASSNRDKAAAIRRLTRLTDTLPTAPLSAVKTDLPSITYATDDPDPHIRSLALFALIALTNRVHSDGTPSGDALPLLEPFLPAITRHLNDPDPALQQLTSLFLGGFLADPTPAIAPLLSALESPAAPTSFDISVVVALLTLGAGSPGHPEIAPEIVRFLLRHDIPSALTPRLLNAIASHPRHSIVLDTSLLVLLDPARPLGMRIALISILPHLTLALPDFEATRTRLSAIIVDPSESPAMQSSAREVLSCWHSSPTFDPCPAPSVHYRMLPNAPKLLLNPPAYQSPPMS